MAPRNSPTVWRRWLAAELKSLREGLGLNQKEVAADCGWSGARLSYLEKGVQVPTEDDLDALLPLYGVAGDDVSRFYEAVKHAGEKGWWERADDRDVPPFLRDFIGLEQGASLIRTVEPYVVPGLLQTRSYVVANLKNDVVTRSERQIARIAELRLRRQEVLSPEHGAGLQVVMDESILHRVVGGPDVMAAQLRHILVIDEQPNVTLRVFPFGGGVNSAMFSSYRILSFQDQAPVLYLEHREGARYLDDEATVEDHLVVFDDLASRSLSTEDSAALIAEKAESYERAARGQR